MYFHLDIIHFLSLAFSDRYNKLFKSIKPLTPEVVYGYGIPSIRTSYVVYINIKRVVCRVYKHTYIYHGGW